MLSFPAIPVRIPISGRMTDLIPLKQTRKNVVKKQRTQCKCPVCDKLFPRKANLTRHLKIHTGVKPYECPACSKSFVTKGNWKTHLRVHLKPPKFYCEFCGKSYARKGFLDKHIAIHLMNGDEKQDVFIDQVAEQKRTFLKTLEQNNLSKIAGAPSIYANEPCVESTSSRTPPSCTSEGLMKVPNIRAPVNPLHALQKEDGEISEYEYHDSPENSLKNTPQNSSDIFIDISPDISPPGIVSSGTLSSGTLSSGTVSYGTPSGTSFDTLLDATTSTPSVTAMDTYFDISSDSSFNTPISDSDVLSPANSLFYFMMRCVDSTQLQQMNDGSGSDICATDEPMSTTSLWQFD